MGNSQEDQHVVRPYRVLSLDGGGMRGIYTGAFLSRLADQFARIRGESALDLGRGFDLITGTSTGGIVACALAIGRPMSEIVRLYREHGREIWVWLFCTDGFPAILRAFLRGRVPSGAVFGETAPSHPAHTPVRVTCRSGSRRTVVCLLRPLPLDIRAAF